MTENTTDQVRVRFAPSPTGLLHIGGLRTALYNFLFARCHRGTFILRIEDTDRSRYVDEAERDIMESLSWAGLAADEGPFAGGPHAPYHQSQRADQYRKYAHALVSSGYAYRAFDTPLELEEMKDRLKKAGSSNPAYNAAMRMQMRNSLALPASEVERLLETGTPHVVRLRVPPGETIVFEDLIRGRVSFATSEIDDQVLMKSDGMPTYHLANVVDDYLMGISHVIRGEEWLSSTPKHMLLYRFLGWGPPAMAHLPLILSPTGGKLSKRNAESMGIPVAVRQYRQAGYEPDALINFLALLGWNPGDEREMFALADLIREFSIDRIGSSGVQFNLDKLKWYNEQYVRMMNPAELSKRVRPSLRQAGLEASEGYLTKVTALMQDRVSLAGDIVDAGSYFFADPDTYDEKVVRKRWKGDSADLVRAYADYLAAQSGELKATEAEEALRNIVETRGQNTRSVMPVMRLALTGAASGPGMFDTMAVLGRETCVRRLRRAADVLEARTDK